MRARWKPLLILFVVGCGAGPTGPDGGGAGTDLLPLRVGNSWTYRVAKDGDLSMKTLSVEAEEPVGGTGPLRDRVAFRLKSAKIDDLTLSWQGVEGDRVVRYREQAFKRGTGLPGADDDWSPPKLVVDGLAARTTSGARYLDSYVERHAPIDGPVETTTVTDEWTVEAEAEPIDVPGRGLMPALRLRKFRRATGLDKRLWYVRGVGKVREEGGQLEILTAFEVRE